jgi:hypothetical protein
MSVSATNLPVIYTDTSSAILSNSFDRPVSISDNTYDMLIGILQKRTANPAAARNLAAAVIQGLSSQDLDINDIIDRLKASSDSEIDEILAIFLNNTRVGTSYVGLSSQTATNPYVVRTILP